MCIRRLTLTVLASLCAALGALAWGTPAGAFVTHRYLSQFNEVPANLGGPLTPVGTSMTVDSGHVWIAEPKRVDEFNASTGVFLSQLIHSEGSILYGEYGIAVGHAAGEGRVYVGEAGESHAVAVFDEAGALKATWTGAATPKGSFASVDDVAVDNSTSPLDEDKGYVYVDSFAEKAIDIFKPEADGHEHYVGRIEGIAPGEPFTSPFKIALNDSNGNLIVENEGIFDILEPQALGTYALVGKISGTPNGPLRDTFNLAVDPVSGEIYLTEGFEPMIVDQFSPTGAYLGRFTGADTPGGDLNDVYALAVGPESQDVYITDSRGEKAHPSAVDVFSPDLVLPDVTTGPSSSVKPLSATLTGTVNPDEAGPATCQVAWGTSSAFGHVTPCSPPEVPNGGAAQAVHAVPDELEPDTTYYYRFQATNKNGTNLGEARQNQQFTTPGPGMHGASAANVAATSATLRVAINPHKAPTTYYFQYGATAGYGADAPAFDEASPRGQLVGSGEGDMETSQHLQGLQPSTLYHYRVVVVSEAAPGLYEEFAGPDQTFTTQSVGGPLVLADNRSWEMVSSPEKRGAELSPISEQGGIIRAAANGDALTYVTNTPVESEPKGLAGKVQELSVRGAAGWTPITITVPHSEVAGQPVGVGPEYRGFSSDLSQAVIQPLGPFAPLSVEASERTAFLRSAFLNGDVDEPCASSCYRPLVTGAPGYANVPPGTVFGGRDGGAEIPPPCYSDCGPLFVSATPDLRHVVVRANAGLTAGAGSGGGLYEWSAGKLAFVGGGVLGNRSSQGIRHAISDDGSRVVFNDAPSIETEEKHELLMRDTESGQLVRLDEVQGGTGEGPAAPRFQGASSDGSRVFFTDTQQLTAHAGIEERDLYECEIVSEASGLVCRLTDLTPEIAGEAARVQGGILGMSEDGSWIYFMADGRFGTAAAPGTCKGEDVFAKGMCNLYALHFNGAEWETPKLIARLSGEEDWHDWQEHVSGQPTEASPNGAWLAFMAQESLTAYDNRDAVTGKTDAEVYLYDAQAGRLVCASCDPTGARPVGREYHFLEEAGAGLVGGTGQWESEAFVAANVMAWQQTAITGQVEDYQSRYLFDDGRLIFNSGDALVPQDVDGTEDVYEYEPPGAGTCTTASVTFGERSGGCVGLISSGNSPTESAFLDSSEGGADVFFLTKERLVPKDFDTSVDIYDAHECTTAVPCVAPLTSPPPCSTGDACKPAPTPQPAIYGTPASATFSGAGNVAPPASQPVTTKRRSTRTQKLAPALRACRKRGHRARVVCERREHRRFASRGGKASAGKGGR